MRMVNGVVKRTDCLTQIARFSPIAMFLVASMLFGGEIRAQESSGQAEVAVQVYYMSWSGQSLTETSGLTENCSQFIDGLGLITSNVEGCGDDGFRTGN